MKKEYALYKGDECLAIGTCEEIATKMNVKPETVMFYGTKTYKRRIANRCGDKNTRLLVRL